MPGNPKRRQAQGLEPHPSRDDPARRARGYSWPPFEAGNTLSLKHGARSERVFGPLAAELVAWLLEHAPDLTEARYRVEVARWAALEARVSIYLFALGEAVANEGPESERAEQLERRLDRIEGRAAKARAALGLTPSSHASLVQGRAAAESTVIDLDALRARGREALEARAIEDE